jgi:hypothetical protein
MEVAVKTSDMTTFEPGDLMRIGKSLRITLPNSPEITIRLTLSQWKVLRESSDNVLEGR